MFCDPRSVRSKSGYSIDSTIQTEGLDPQGPCFKVYS